MYCKVISLTHVYAYQFNSVLNAGLQGIIVVYLDKLTDSVDTNTRSSAVQEFGWTVLALGQVVQSSNVHSAGAGFLSYITIVELIQHQREQEYGLMCVSVRSQKQKT